MPTNKCIQHRLINEPLLVPCMSQQSASDWHQVLILILLEVRLWGHEWLHACKSRSKERLYWKSIILSINKGYCKPYESFNLSVTTRHISPIEIIFHPSSVIIKVTNFCGFFYIWLCPNKSSWAGLASEFCKPNDSWLSNSTRGRA